MDEKVSKKEAKARKKEAKAHYKLGVDLGTKGLIDEAIREYQEAIRIRPDLAEAHYNLGFALVGKGLIDEAIREYKEAIRIDPEDAVAHSNLGVVLRTKGLTDEAIREYKEAIRIRPDLAVAHYNLGVVLGIKGLTDEAIREYKEAIRIRPEYAKAHYNLGVALRTKGLTDEDIREYQEVHGAANEGHTETAALLLDRGATTQAPATTDQPQVAIQADTDTKVCPYCAETIKAAAIKCRYCGSVLEPLTAVAEVPAATGAKTQFTVILVSAGENWIPVIKEVRAITGLDLKNAKALLETTPRAVIVIKVDVNSDEAAWIKKQLENAGAEVEVE